jgi:hypothetical protein
MTDQTLAGPSRNGPQSLSESDEELMRKLVVHWEVFKDLWRHLMGPGEDLILEVSRYVYELDHPEEKERRLGEESVADQQEERG